MANWTWDEALEAGASEKQTASQEDSPGNA
jgi:hypothetical protein